MPMRCAHKLLDDHGHLFLFQAVRSGSHVGFRVAAEGGGIDPLDGVD